MFLNALVQRRAASEPIEVRVRNISATGLMATCAHPIESGELVEITLRGVGVVSARVVWSRENRIGLAFEQAIDPRLTRQSSQPKTAVVPPVQDGRRPGLGVR